MSIDWTHQYCLACDKQTDGAAYCSEACRLADYENNSSSKTNSAASSPALGNPSSIWSLSTPSKPSLESYPSPAYDDASPRPAPSGRHDAIPDYFLIDSRKPSQILTPSSSYSSLSSLNSTMSASRSSHRPVSDKAQRELQLYTHSMEMARQHRKRT